MMPELPAQFHFLRPEWFWLLIPAVLFLATLWWRRLRQSGLEQICDASLLPYLLLDKGRGSGKRPLSLLGLAWLLAVTALAGPVWEKQPQPVYRLENGRVLVLDLSPSMAATDITPSRLDRARYKIEDILKMSREGRTALVVFSAEPHVVVPLTDDIATIASMLPALSVEIMPEFGDSAGRALEQAATLLKQGGLKGGDIILISDGIDDLASSLVTAEKLRKQGARLSVLGVGGNSGAPMPDPSGSGFVTDSNGSPLLSHFDPSSLRELASSGGGRYTTFTADGHDINMLLTDSDRHSLHAGEAANKNIDRWQEEGVWLVLPILLLALGGFRRGWLVCLLLLLTLRPGAASALTWQDFWQRPDQQAAKQLADGNAPKAAELFTDPAWRAVAQYEAGNYKDAIETGKSLRDAAGQYNLGNSLAKAGRLDEALKAYGEALQLNPEDADARHNRELVQKLQEQQKKEQQNQQSDNAADQQQQGEQKNGQGNDRSQQENKDKQSGDQSAQQQQDNDTKQEQQGGQADNSSASQQPGDRQKPEEKPGSAGKKDQGQDEKSSAEQGGQDRNQPQDERNKKQTGQGQESGAEQPLTAQQKEKDKNGQAGAPTDEQRQEARAPLSGNPEVEVPDKEDLVLEQWLRQVPDDPSGLLRRKFMLEHQRRLQEKNR